MKRALGTAVLAAVALAAAACGSTRVNDAAKVSVSAGRVTESRLIEAGTILCTATVRTTPVQAGSPLGNARVTFTFHNISGHKAMLSEGWQEGSAVVKSPDGTTYDLLSERQRGPGDIVFSLPIAAGATKKGGKVYLPRVSWEGPLRIVPRCGTAALPPVEVAVLSPGLPPSERVAVNEVVAATGDLLKHCRPHAAGVPVLGRVEPRHGALPAFRARCSVTLHRERGFYVAQMLVFTPPGLRGVRVVPPYQQIQGPGGFKSNTQKIAWEFVVTRRGAISTQSAIGLTATGRRSWATPGEKTSNRWCGGSEGESFGSAPPRVRFSTSVCHSG